MPNKDLWRQADQELVGTRGGPCSLEVKELAWNWIHNENK